MKGTLVVDHDVEALIAGQVPLGRPDLAELAELLADLHQPTTGPPPTPSSELMDWMQAQRPAPTPIVSPPSPVRPPGRPVGRRLAAGIAGLGISVQAALGATAAAAAITGAGVAGVLPDTVQRPFDDVRDRLGLSERIDSPSPPSNPRPGPGEDLPPAQDTTVGQTETETTPAPSGTSGPDPGRRGEPDDSVDEPASDQTDPEPGSSTQADLENDQEADTSDEPAGTDRDEEPNSEGSDNAEDTPDDAAQDPSPPDGDEPDAPDGGTQAGVVNDAPDAVGSDLETSTSDTSASGGTSDDALPEDSTERRSDGTQDEPSDGSAAQ